MTDGAAMGTWETGLQTDEEDSPAALLALIRDYEHPIIPCLQVLLGDQEQALDCAQDTFLRAYDHLRRGRAIAPAWLYTVARNRATDEFRRQKRVHPSAEPLERIAIDGEQRVMAEVKRYRPEPEHGRALNAMLIGLKRNGLLLLILLILLTAVLVFAIASLIGT